MGESLLARKTREVGGPEELVRQLGPGKVLELTRTWRAVARPEQLEPEGDWDTWFIKAGRFWGKTRTGAEWTHELARKAARWIQEGTLRAEQAEIHIVGPTAADVRDVMVRGPAGILACSSPAFPATYTPGARRIDWPCGVYALLFSGEAPDRLRGPQGIGAWCDELPAWQYPEECWDNLQFGLRLGPDPRTCCTTTPRATAFVKELLKAAGTHVTHGRSKDNSANVAAKALKRLYDKYGGTRLGRQELDGDVLDDNPNALWALVDIDRLRVRLPAGYPIPQVLVNAGWDEPPEDSLSGADGVAAIIRDLPRRAAWARLTLAANGVDLDRVVVACDPSGSDNANSDECGIVVAGAGMCRCRGEPQRHGFVLADLSGTYSPSGWGALLVASYRAFAANRIVAEINYGGQLVEANLRAADGGANLPYSGVHVKKGKALRAEPVSALTEQGKAHHVGSFAKLEDELTGWDPLDATAKSPNRLDAMVFGLTELLIEGGVASFAGIPKNPGAASAGIIRPPSSWRRR